MRKFVILQVIALAVANVNTQMAAKNSVPGAKEIMMFFIVLAVIAGIFAIPRAFQEKRHSKTKILLILTLALAAAAGIIGLNSPSENNILIMIYLGYGAFLSSIFSLLSLKEYK